VRDREYHQLYPGVLRPELRALLEHHADATCPQPTPQRPVRYRSPATSRDIP
jgi:hypothetical protein